MTLWIRIVLFLLTILLLASYPAFGSTDRPDPQQGVDPGDRRMTRIDFGNAYIRGQTIQSGAVYLLQRKKSDVESLLKPRESYRKEILHDFHIQETPRALHQPYLEADGTLRDQFFTEPTGVFNTAELLVNQLGLISEVSRSRGKRGARRRAARA